MTPATRILWPNAPPTPALSGVRLPRRRPAKKKFTAAEKLVGSIEAIKNGQECEAPPVSP